MNTNNSAVWLGLALLAMPSCNRSRTNEAGSTASVAASAARLPPNTVRLTPEAAKIAQLELEPVKKATLTRTLVFQGDVQAIPERLAAIVAQLEGLVTSVRKREGDKVKKGEAMVTIKSKKLAEAKLAYLEAEHQLDFATGALEREQQLMDKRISSKEEYQRVAHDKEAAELNHSAALQRLRLLGFSETRLHELEENPNQSMTDYTLHAPFAGEVVAKDVTLGEAVLEDKTLFQLADLSELQVQIKVPIETVPLLTKGDRAHVVCSTVGLSADGVIGRISSVADTETRSVTVKVNIPNTDGKWRPGLPAQVELEHVAPEARVVIPLEAVHELDGKPSVFVVVAPETFRVQPVSLGQKGDQMQEVLEGLEAGVKVATKNSLVLKSEWLEAKGR